MGSATLSQIGRLVHELREDAGLTQIELAKRLKTSQSAIARIERGEQNLTTEMLAKISKVLNKNLVNISRGTIDFHIGGNTTLSGAVTTKTSKNAATALLIASLMNHGTTRLARMPRIQEVHRIIEVLESIGVSVRWDGSDVVISPAHTIDVARIDEDAARKTRSIIMLVGALSGTHGQFTLPYAGGCKLGLRSVSPHTRALAQLGIRIEKDDEHSVYHINAAERTGGYVVLPESGDTVTENALMAAALIPGTSTIRYASANYQVQDLCFFLQALGVSIEGVGTSTLTVRGVARIEQDITFELSEDPTDAIFFIAAAAVTGSAITIERAPIEFLELELLMLEQMGLSFSCTPRYLSRNGRAQLTDITMKPSKLVAPPEKVFPMPYPGLNIDNLPFFAVIATQAQGQTLIHDWVYEGRAIHYTELAKLGADVILADPHRVYVSGPTKLTGAELACPPALRPAAILLIGMLAADGASVLRDVYSINRGYEDIARRLRELGADIEILAGT